MQAPESREALQPAEQGKSNKGPRLFRWQQRVLHFCFIAFAFELGLILIVFPWNGSWDLHWVPAQSDFLRAVWLNHYFRGALSGIGVLNVYIALAEFYRWLRSLFH